LLTELLRVGAVSGFHAVFARISGSSAASIGLHRSCGFELVGIEREVGRKFNKWLDVALMQGTPLTRQAEVLGLGRQRQPGVLPSPRPSLRPAASCSASSDSSQWALVVRICRASSSLAVVAAARSRSA
jgi:hypothetical protein